VTGTRYRTTAAVQAAVITCLWYSVFGTRQVQVVLIQDRSVTGYDLALVTTDPNGSAGARRNRLRPLVPGGESLVSSDATAPASAAG
jgi:hypothetical protein